MVSVTDVEVVRLFSRGKPKEKRFLSFSFIPNLGSCPSTNFQKVPFPSSASSAPGLHAAWSLGASWELFFQDQQVSYSLSLGLGFFVCLLALVLFLLVLFLFCFSLFVFLIGFGFFCCWFFFTSLLSSCLFPQNKTCHFPSLDIEHTWLSLSCLCFWSLCFWPVSYFQSFFHYYALKLNIITRDNP